MNTDFNLELSELDFDQPTRKEQELKEALCFFNNIRPTVKHEHYGYVNKRVTRKVHYELTTRGWLSDEQRAAIIRNLDAEDYELLGESKDVEEYSHTVTVWEHIPEFDSERAMTDEELIAEWKKHIITCNLKEENNMAKCVKNCGECPFLSGS